MGVADLVPGFSWLPASRQRFFHAAWASIYICLGGSRSARDVGDSGGVVVVAASASLMPRFTSSTVMRGMPDVEVLAGDVAAS